MIGIQYRRSLAVIMDKQRRAAHVIYKGIIGNRNSRCFMLRLVLLRCNGDGGVRIFGMRPFFEAITAYGRGSSVWNVYQVRRISLWPIMDKIIEHFCDQGARFYMVSRMLL